MSRVIINGPFENGFVCAIGCCAIAVEAFCGVCVGCWCFPCIYMDYLRNQPLPIQQGSTNSNGCLFPNPEMMQ